MNRTTTFASFSIVPAIANPEPIWNWAGQVHTQRPPICRLCAFNAGKPGNVDRAALERNPDACSVENGVLLGMAAPSVFCAGYAGVAVCTENLNTGVAVMKSAQDGA
jgi:hypothetical protein